MGTKGKDLDDAERKKKTIWEKQRKRLRLRKKNEQQRRMKMEIVLYTGPDDGGATDVKRRRWRLCLTTPREKTDDTSEDDAKRLR